MTGQRIAITGATGFIGSEVAKLLYQRGAILKLLSRSYNRGADVGLASGEWVIGDISDPHAWDNLLEGCSAVVHLGAAGVADLDNMSAALHTNLPAYTYMLEAAKRHNIRRLVVAGSCFEYGLTGSVIRNRGLRETDSLDPVNAYAAAKAAATLLMGPLCRNLQLEAFILRPFHTYGHGEMQSRLFPSVMRAAISDLPIHITNGTQVRDFIHLSDVARAFVQAVDVRWLPNEPGAQVINIGTGLGTSVLEVARLIARACGRDKSRVVPGSIPPRPREMACLVADISKARTVLGWTPTVSLTAGIKMAIASSGTSRA
jgi:UDP-glucose 4-epimerase